MSVARHEFFENALDTFELQGNDLGNKFVRELAVLLSTTSTPSLFLSNRAAAWIVSRVAFSSMDSPATTATTVPTLTDAQAMDILSSAVFSSVSTLPAKNWMKSVPSSVLPLHDSDPASTCWPLALRQEDCIHLRQREQHYLES
jgi:hypothetical protein